MKLIGADAFEKFIKEKYKDGESTDDIKDQMLFDLSYQPTAYDIEKVLKQLKEAEKDVSKLGTCAIPTDEAIKIALKGGV